MTNHTMAFNHGRTIAGAICLVFRSFSFGCFPETELRDFPRSLLRNYWILFSKKIYDNFLPVAFKFEIFSLLECYAAQFVVTDVSEQPIRPNFKRQAFQEEA